MTGKIFRSSFAVAAAVLLVSAVLLLAVFYEYYGSIQERQLTDELELASVSVEQYGKDYLKQIKTDGYRLTWVAADGTVLCDTQAAAETMENHAGREEVQEALKTGRGESTRYSKTLTEKTSYYAERLDDGTVLRISVRYATVGAVLLGILQPILLVLLLALVFSAVLAHRLSRRIVEPLNELDLEKPLENETYPELSPLLNRIEHQHQEIRHQLSKLQQRTDEFMQITANMNEGLVLLDNEETVLSINPAAQQVFGTDAGAVGRDFVSVDRSHDLSMAIRAAYDGGHSEVRAERGGREYQFDISRIESAGEPLGAVILTFDVTEQEHAERSRREFTANVSHELKTPLQGIIGSAELIENGMVKPEDMPRFVGHIRQEAARLVALIGDIIRLSQLDEDVALPSEPVDLLDIAQEVRTNLSPAATAKGVTLRVDGSGARMNGVHRLLYEIVYNLADNAIKYNREGGNVRITAETEGRDAVVRVADDGIGIAQEHQEHVFERFYRVDKSRSKASGGTGLGLSIVKHAVQYHRGTIRLESTPSVGTTVTVRFPQ